MSGWRQKPPPVALVWAERQCPGDLGGLFASLTKHPHTSGQVGQVDNRVDGGRGSTVDGGRGSTVANSKCKTDIGLHLPPSFSRTGSPGCCSMHSAPRNIHTGQTARWTQSAASEPALVGQIVEVPGTPVLNCRFTCRGLGGWTAGLGPAPAAPNDGRQCTRCRSGKQAVGARRPVDGGPPGPLMKRSLVAPIFFGLEAFGDPNGPSMKCPWVPLAHSWHVGTTPRSRTS